MQCSFFVLKSILKLDIIFMLITTQIEGGAKWKNNLKPLMIF